MDIIVLIIALYLLFINKWAWVLFVIIFLTTDYLGIGINISNFPVEHNVSDVGLILYISLCFKILNKNEFKFLKTPLSNYIIIFYFFLLISFFVDLFFGFWYMLVIVAGYLSHLVLDMLNHQGVGLFFPIIKWRIKGFLKSGGFFEKAVFALCIVGILVYTTLNL